MSIAVAVAVVVAIEWRRGIVGALAQLGYLVVELDVVVVVVVVVAAVAAAAAVVEAIYLVKLIKYNLFIQYN